MKLGVSKSPAQSDTGQNYYIVWGAELSYLSNAASRRVPCRWAVDAESGTLVARAKVGRSCACTPSTSSRRWQAVAGRRRAGRWRRLGGRGAIRRGSCDPSATSSAVRFRSCVTGTTVALFIGLGFGVVAVH